MLITYYGSDDWRLGPREALLALIESYVDVVELDEVTINGFRKGEYPIVTRTVHLVLVSIF